MKCYEHMFDYTCNSVKKASTFFIVHGIIFLDEQQTLLT